MAFADFKKKRTQMGAALNKKFEDLESNPFEDKRFWTLTVDKAGNGSAEIRLLPAKDGEDVPFVQLYSHAFKGPGGWYMENCLTTNGTAGKQMGACPVCENNHELWNSNIDANIAIVRGTDDSPGRKRKLTYISNILVIKDPANPENNGKVFLFKYGAKIFEKIQEARTDETEGALNPFDMWEGATFVLKAKKDKGFRSYAGSKFLSKSEVGSEKDMEKIYNTLFSVEEFITPDKFRSADELTKRLNKTLGNTQRLGKTVEPEAETVSERPAGRTRAAKVQPEEETTSDTGTSDDDEPQFDLSKFKELAGDD